MPDFATKYPTVLGDIGWHIRCAGRTGYKGYGTHSLMVFHVILFSLFNLFWGLFFSGWYSLTCFPLPSICCTGRPLSCFFFDNIQKKIMIIICCVILGVVIASIIGGTLAWSFTQSHANTQPQTQNRAKTWMFSWMQSTTCPAQGCVTHSITFNNSRQDRAFSYFFFFSFLFCMRC